MRALTVQQPWAWAIVHGGKDVENRTQAWGYRGLLAIHAGARHSDRANDALIDALRTAMERGTWEPLKYGAIIGVVDLVGVHSGPNTETDRQRAVRSCFQPGKPFGSCSPWGERDVVHLVLEHPRPLAEPIPCKGRLGLWTPDAELLDRIREQM